MNVGEPANEEKEGSGDSSICSQAPVFLVRLGSCNVYCACFYSLQPTTQKDWISRVDALSSPGHFFPFHQEVRSTSKRWTNEIENYNFKKLPPKTPMSSS